MTTLHKMTEKTKMILKWSSVAIITLILLLSIFRVGKNLKEYFFPTPPPPPTVSFGKLPKIAFPKNAIDKDLEYSLDTVSGKLPSFEDRATVYKMIALKPNLLSLKRAQDLVNKIGFYSQGLPLSETVYQWESPDSKKIVIDILSFNFQFYSDFFSQTEILSAQSLPNENEAITEAVSFLTDLSSFPNDIDLSKTKTTLLSIKDSRLEVATSLSNTQLIRVEFFQKDINKLPIFYPHPPKSTMNVLVGSGKHEGQVVEANFFHQGITEISATYPIKTADEAFSELKNGKAYIAGYSGNSRKILIKNVFLGYYMDEELQEYALPIIVFEGSNGFWGYVEAIKNDWISS